MEALAEVAVRGWHALAADVPDLEGRDAQPVEAGGAASSELHWHDFDTVTLLVERSARVVFGFDRSLTDFTQPANKPATKPATELAVVES